MFKKFIKIEFSKLNKFNMNIFFTQNAACDFVLVFLTHAHVVTIIRNKQMSVTVSWPAVRVLHELDDGGGDGGVVAVGAVMTLLVPHLQQHAVRHRDAFLVQPVERQPVRPERVLRNLTSRVRWHLLSEYLPLVLQHITGHRVRTGGSLQWDFTKTKNGVRLESHNLQGNVKMKLLTSLQILCF